jgi:hypothetical protein
MVAKPRRTIISGKVQVNFIVRGNIEAIPTKPRNTISGILKLSTPEATAFDLTGYYRHCGWLDNVATALSKLVEVIDPERLVTVAASGEKRSTILQKYYTIFKQSKSRPELPTDNRTFSSA